MLESDSALVESLLHIKNQNNQLTSLEKHYKSQRGTDQPNKVSNQHQHNQTQNHQPKNCNQNKHQTHFDTNSEITSPNKPTKGRSQ